MEATSQQPRCIPLYDLHPEPVDFLVEVWGGLSKQKKRLPSMYLYDGEGSRLFERICQLEEYYPTRLELGLLETYVSEIAERLGADCMLLELGSGSSEKTRIVLRHMDRPHSYVPIDIARDALRTAAARLALAFPRLSVLPVCADFMAASSLPPTRRAPLSRAVFFPGSTIGNYDREERGRLFNGVHAMCGDGGHFLIGFDLQKDSARLERAYNDELGVTAAFNLNLLRRINRELDADFDLSAFCHHARYDADEARIEMHLVSRASQVVHVGGRRFEFRAGESVCTEHSYKFTIDGLLEEVGAAGFFPVEIWTDPARWFAIALLGATPR
jgi:dimethylhistidine N-methyltransferase